MSSAYVDASKLLDQLQTLEAGIHNNAKQALRAGVHVAFEAARNTTEFKDRTGTTRQSIQENVEGFSGSIKAGSAATFLEAGTRPHVIEARGGGTLRFVVGDRIIFRRRVNHPGTRETRFMGQAADRGEQALEYGLDYFTDAAITKFNTSE